jgi:hypothetical protein
MSPEVLLAEGYGDALVGYVEQFGRPAIALYDKDRCIEILMERDLLTCLRDGHSMQPMGYEEAVKFFELKTLGAYIGEKTPAFATLRERCVFLGVEGWKG